MALAKVEPGKTRIGWIGTGVMGRWMCQHLISKGYSATVYNRSRDKAQPLDGSWRRRTRIRRRPSPSVRTSSSPSSAFRRTFARCSSDRTGVLAGTKAGAILVDMTTSEPSLAVEIAKAAKTKGAHALDAPVSGGDVGAKNAALSIMIGGEKDVVAAVTPLFECMGKTIVHQGGPAPGSTRRWSTRF